MSGGLRGKRSTIVARKDSPAKVGEFLVDSLESHVVRQRCRQLKVCRVGFCEYEDEKALRSSGADGGLCESQES